MPPCMTDTLMTPTYMLLILSIVSFVLQSVMVPMRSPNATEAMSHPGLQKEKNSWGVKYAQLWCAWHVSSLRIDGFPTPPNAFKICMGSWDVYLPTSAAKRSSSPSRTKIWVAAPLYANSTMVPATETGRRNFCCQSDRHSKIT